MEEGENLRLKRAQRKRLREQMPLGPVNPEERVLWVLAQRQTQRAHPWPLYPSFYRPALQDQAVSAENKDCRALLGGGDSGTQLPAGPPALTPNTGQLRTPVPWAEVRCLFKEAALVWAPSPASSQSDEALAVSPRKARATPVTDKGIREPSLSPPPQPLGRRPQAHRSGSGELLQVILNLTGVTGGCNIDKFQKPLFEGQLAEKLPSLSAVGAGGLDEHDHLPRLDLAVDERLSHAASLWGGTPPL